MTPTKSDNLFSEPISQIKDFVFDQGVVSVFPDMIQRSVPGYATIIHMIGQLAESYAQPESLCYDLGCSLGAATLAMRHGIHTPKTKIVAIDNSEAMVARCRELIAVDKGTVPVEVCCADLLEVAYRPSSLNVMNFTLQFISIDQRLSLLQRIADATLAGGLLILSEKVVFDYPPHQKLMEQLHHNFKQANGYSELEIAQKRIALENILLPESVQTHKERLLEAGFKSVDLWFQCFNFASFIALK